jgi:hypothetical protein
MMDDIAALTPTGNPTLQAAADRFHKTIADAKAGRADATTLRKAIRSAEAVYGTAFDAESRRLRGQFK